MKGLPKDVPTVVLPNYRNAAGRRWGGENCRGHLTVSKHTDPLVQYLFGHLNAERTTIEECAQRAGIHHDAIKGWRARFSPKAANLQAALNAVGLELVIVPQGAVLPSHIQGAKARAMDAVRYREPKPRPRKPKEPKA